MYLRWMPQLTQFSCRKKPNLPSIILKKNLSSNRKLSPTLKTFAAGRKRKQSPFTSKNTQQPHKAIPHKGTKQPESGHQPSKTRWHHMGEGRRKQKSRTLPAMMIQQSLVTLCLATSSNSNTLSLAIAEPYALGQNSPPKESARCSRGIEESRPLRRKRWVASGWPVGVDSPAPRFETEAEAVGEVKAASRRRWLWRTGIRDAKRNRRIWTGSARDARAGI